MLYLVFLLHISSFSKSNVRDKVVLGNMVVGQWVIVSKVSILLSYEI